MDQDTQDVQADVLFVALTRPSTVMGVPYTAVVIEGMASVLIFLAVGNPLYLALVLPLHGVMYLVGHSDPGVFSSIAVWMKTAGRSRTRGFWGAASTSPLATQKWRQ